MTAASNRGVGFCDPCSAAARAAARGKGAWLCQHAQHWRRRCASLHLGRHTRTCMYLHAAPTCARETCMRAGGGPMQVFEPAPPGTRKAILATNIAETSITIPGVRWAQAACLPPLHLLCCTAFVVPLPIPAQLPLRALLLPRVPNRRATITSVPKQVPLPARTVRDTPAGASPRSSCAMW